MRFEVFCFKGCFEVFTGVRSVSEVFGGVLGGFLGV